MHVVQLELRNATEDHPQSDFDHSDGGRSGLCGCVGDGGSPYSGRAILAELEHSNISLADENGRAADSAPLPADELPASSPITLADQFRVAEARNPGLAVARSEVGVSAGQFRQASLYPNPTVELSSEEIPFDGGITESKSTIGLIQPIILGARRHAATSAADPEQAASLALLCLGDRLSGRRRVTRVTSTRLDRPR
jgi:hypothetical protein